MLEANDNRYANWDRCSVKIQTYIKVKRNRWLTKPLLAGRYSKWLNDTGSLTNRLKAISSDFQVKLVNKANSTASFEELSKLGCKHNQKAYVRDVFLISRGLPVVFAHSVLPYSSIKGPWFRLKRLGNKPLGEVLFSDPRVSRTALTFKKLNCRDILHEKAVESLPNLPKFLWARRSVFKLNGSCILVNEIFLNEILTQ